jgi:hypothetical protein
MRFYAIDLTLDFGSGVEAWLSIHQRCSEPLALLVSLLYSPSPYVDVSLLWVAQAVEAYHRCMFSNRRWTEAEFKRRRHAVLDRFSGEEDEEARKWLAELVSFSNEPSFAERLTALDSRARPVLEGLFDRRPGWVAELKNMRNRYTHRGGSAPSYSRSQLFNMSRFARIVVDVCLMLDLGISAEVCRSRAEGWSDFSWAMSEGLQDAAAKGRGGT